MKNQAAVVILVVFAALSHGEPTGAQELSGFAGAGMVSDVNDQRFPAFGGGVLLDLPTWWISAGTQGEMFVSWPYVAGRGAVFGQLNAVRRRAVRPFFLAGYGFGESAGSIIGGGVELRLRDRRIGLRASVEDYLTAVQGFDCASLGYTQSHCDEQLHAGRPYIGHQLTLRLGLMF